MASDPIFDTLKQHLTPSMIQQMSANIGADPEATAKAVGLAIPALLGGLSRNASQPQGAADLDRALNEVRDEMIRQLTDMKTKSEPRNNKHLRDTVRD